MARPVGLSLLETVLSVFIFSLVVLLLFELLPTSLLAVRRAEQRQLAGHLAASLAAERMARPFQGLAEGIEPLDPVTSEGVEFTPTVEVFRLPDFEPERLKGIRVTVTWQERGKTWTVRREVLVSGVRR